MASEPTAWKQFTVDQWDTWIVSNWDNFLIEIVSTMPVPFYYMELFTDAIPTRRGPHVESS